jgi:hypothetical protein
VSQYSVSAILERGQFENSLKGGRSLAEAVIKRLVKTAAKDTCVRVCVCVSARPLVCVSECNGYL